MHKRAKVEAILWNNIPNWEVTYLAAVRLLDDVQYVVSNDLLTGLQRVNSKFI